MSIDNPDKLLNYETIKDLSLKTEDLPVKVLQFGEGNFLRAFIDWMIYRMNKKGLFNGKVTVVQPLEHGMIDMMEKQDYLYTLFLRGVQSGEVKVEKEIIDVIEKAVNVYTDFDGYLKEAENPDLRLIVSNTTEAGIVLRKEDRPEDLPPVSFPGKLLLFLRKRYDFFNGDMGKGFLILPCELIDRNGDNLKKILSVLASDWYPGDSSFQTWLTEANVYFNTLVDRIVSGYPRDEVETLWEECGYKDNLVDTGEIFHFLVIEGDGKYKAELPLHEAGLEVKWTDDMSPYRTRKVRILNGAHTMTVLAAWLYGLETVKNCMDDDVLSAYIKKGIYDEIIPTLDLPKEELEFFGNAVLERFSNPYLKHFLLTISLNSVSKFRTRVLPSLLEYINRNKKLPELLTFSLAALVLFYRGETRLENTMIAHRAVDGSEYEINDSPEVLDFFFRLWSSYKDEDSPDYKFIMQKVLGKTEYWDRDLNEVEGLADAAASFLKRMISEGVPAVMRDIV